MKLSAVILLVGSSLHSTSYAFDIIAHRGASGYLPEHTLESTAMAHAQAPDFIEQDLVLSKDGILVVLHDIHLDTVTNVESMFPTRKRGDGRWYVIDFTLAELKQLRVHERRNSNNKQVFPNRYQGSGNFQIATFEEHVSTIQSLNRVTGKNIGIYPEIKSPAFHRNEGQDISAIVVTALDDYGLNNRDANVFVQCFDFDEVKRLRDELGLNTKLIQLIAENDWQESPTDYHRLKSAEGLKTLTKYVDGIGPWYRQMIRQDDSGAWVKSSFAEQLGAYPFKVHVYTYREEQVPENLNRATFLHLLERAGADGVFTDQVPPVKQWRVAASSAN